MVDLQSILADPAWFAHRYDAASRRIQFARLDRDTVKSQTFIADHKPADSDQTWADVASIDPAQIPSGRSHYIFHSAFVRSTLLSRALDFSGTSLGLSEPAILNDLAYAPAHVQQVLPIALALLARHYGEGEANVIKPSNTANALIPAILALRQEAKAVLLTGSVQNFLRSVHKKGMFGRRWARRLFAHVSGFAPLDLGMSDSDKFETTDLQYAGLAWLLQQRHFAMLLASREGERLRSLESDVFNGNRADTLSALDGFFGLGIGRDAIDQMVASPVFSTHSKSGGDVGEQLEAEAKAADSAVVEEEIQMVTQWIGQIAQQAGLSGGLGRAFG